MKNSMVRLMFDYSYLAINSYFCMENIFKVATYYKQKLIKQASLNVFNNINANLPLNEYANAIMHSLYVLSCKNIDKAILISKSRYNLYDLPKYAGNEDESDAIIQYLKWRKGNIQKLKDSYNKLDDEIFFLLNRYNEYKGKRDVSDDAKELSKLKDEHTTLAATIDAEIRWHHQEYTRMLVTRVRQLKTEKPLTNLDYEQTDEAIKQWLNNYAQTQYSQYEPASVFNKPHQSYSISRPVPQTDPNIIPKQQLRKEIDEDSECPQCGYMSYEKISLDSDQRMCTKCGFHGSN